MDIAENYVMHTSGGSIKWGIQEGEGESNLPEEYKQTFRIYANEKYADVRIAAGRVHDPVPETDDDGQGDLGMTGVGKTEPVVYELTLAKNGFKAEDGALLPSTGNLVKLRFTFDRSGNTFARIDGNVGVLCKKRLRLRVKDEMEIFADNSFNLSVANAAKVTVGGTLEMTGSVIRLNGGSMALARMGDQVSVQLLPNLLMLDPLAPLGFSPIASKGILSTLGVITSGNPTLLG
jgi:hypothetical protein